MDRDDLITTVLLSCGIALLVTLASYDQPPLAYRIHFGTTEFIFGILFGGFVQRRSMSRHT